MPDPELDNLSTEHYERVPPCLYVTRLCTEREKRSPKANEAVMKEVEKFVKYGVWGKPQTREEIIAKYGYNAVWGKAAVIIQIKHIEKEENLRKWKCRGVFHGHRMRRVQNDARYFVEKGSCWIAVASLDSVRVIIARAIILNRLLRGLDIESAYIQAKWPSYEDFPNHKVEPVFVALPPEMTTWLPTELRPEGSKADDFLWPMVRPMYGHPLSGWIFDRHLMDALQKHGWKRNEGHPSLKYLRRFPIREGEEVHNEHFDDSLSSYVDNVMSEFGKTRKEQDIPWNHLKESFNITDPPPDLPQEHLSQVMHWEERESFRVMHFDTNASTRRNVLSRRRQ
eukprot:GHVN01099203.1.p2 GENE.GHVN01099203.1~~GHVN01099203.1.p2  ORF type:complete len:339 (+),score=14.21 GHVN01099203.1:2667-3683(+)